MKTIALVLLSALAIPALADKYVTMPNGGGCWIGNGGAYGCSEPENPAQTAAREARRAEKLRSEKLEKCLRTADWPGQPGRAECQQMYGN